MYNDGKVVARLTDRESNKGGRMKTSYLFEIVTDWYEQTCIGTYCSSWRYAGTTRRLIWIAFGEDSGGYYGTYIYYNSSGQGSVSDPRGCPYGPNCTEPVPYDEQETTNEKEVITPPNWWEFMYKHKTYNDPCAAYRELINAGYANNDKVLSHELGGIIGKELDQNGNQFGFDKFIAFPVTPGDGSTTFDFNGGADGYFYDEQGREILHFWTGGNQTFVETTTYADQGVPAIIARYEVNTLVHTHPYDSGNGWNLPNEPSSKQNASDPDKDIENAAKFPHINHRIVSVEQIVDYDGTGVTNRQVNNCR